MVDSLVRSHAHFHASHFLPEKDFFEELARGQRPEALVLCCADSRVIPELILQAKPGTLFVVRAVANLLPPAGDPLAAAVGSAVEYAVDHLRVHHLVVLGHHGCGGLKAAMTRAIDPAADPHLAAWLRFTDNAVADVTARAPADLDDAARLAAIVEDNVLEQLEHALTYPAVQRALDEGRLTLHGWVYNMENGELTCYHQDERRFTHSHAFDDLGAAGRVTPGQFED